MGCLGGAWWQKKGRVKLVRAETWNVNLEFGLIEIKLSLYSELETLPTQKNSSRSLCILVLICAHYLTCSSNVSAYHI